MELKKRRIQLFVTFIVLFSVAMGLTLWGAFGFDGTRSSQRFSVSIPESPDQSLVYFEYYPTPEAPDKGNRVCFLFTGYQTPIEMMEPVMMELTQAGYNVVMGDFRGEGRSGGELPMDWTKLIRDFDLFYEDVAQRHSDWNMSHVTVVGHSMAGFAVLNFGKNRPQVFNTIAIAPGAYLENVNRTAPKNLLIINGEFDQAIPQEETIDLFQQAVPGGKPGFLYGNPLNGTAKQYLIQSTGRHETECYNDFVLSHTITFIEMGYGYMEPGDIYLARQELRMTFVLSGMVLGVISILPLIMGVETYKKGPISSRIQVPEFKIVQKYMDVFDHWRESIEELIKNSQNLLTPKSKKVPKKENQLKSDVDYGTKPKDLVSTPEGLESSNVKIIDEQGQQIPLQNLLNQRKFNVWKFMKLWFSYLPHGIIISSAVFLVALFAIKNLYIHLQIVLIGYSGVISVFMMRHLYKQVYGEEFTLRKLLGYYWLKIKEDAKLFDVFKALFYAGVIYSVLIFGLGKSFVFPFPLNRRGYQAFFFFPLFFISYLFQTPIFLHYLQDNLREKYKGPLPMSIDQNPLIKAVITTVVCKFGLIYLVGLVLLFWGNFIMTILFLLTMIDLLVSILMVVNYYHNKSYFSVILFGALLATFVYLGFSGYHSGWESVFGSNSVFKWVR